MAGSTCREEVLDAFLRLETTTGSASHRAGEVLREVLSQTSRFKEATITTMVMSVMCADAPVHHVNHTDDLRRVGQGQYARVIEWRGAPPLATGPAPTPEPSLVAIDQPAVPDRHAHWAWEGNVQSAVADALAVAGWQLRSIADTASRAHGVDIVAARDGRRILVEVKGYPAGSRSAGPQARHHFADALLAGILMAQQDSEASRVLAFPDVTTYSSLVRRCETALSGLAIGVLLVTEGGAVTEIVEAAGGSIL